MRERERKNKQTNERKKERTNKNVNERERIASKTSRFPEISGSNFRDQISRPKIPDVN